MNECELHSHLEQCLKIIKKDIKDLEDKGYIMDKRLSAIEPTVEYDHTELISMRKLQLGTLVSALTSALGVIGALVILYLRSH